MPYCQQSLVCVQSLSTKVRKKLLEILVILRKYIRSTGKKNVDPSENVWQIDLKLETYKIVWGRILTRDEVTYFCNGKGS